MPALPACTRGPDTANSSVAPLGRNSTGQPGSILPCSVTWGKVFDLSGLSFLIHENKDHQTDSMALLPE